jgi:hypothetical protein
MLATEFQMLPHPANNESAAQLPVSISPTSSNGPGIPAIIGLSAFPSGSAYFRESAYPGYFPRRPLILSKIKNNKSIGQLHEIVKYRISILHM